MSQAELTQKIKDRLNRQVAFGGMTKRETTEGEVILKCPTYGDLGELACDLTDIFMGYVEEEGLKQIKDIIKDMLK